MKTKKWNDKKGFTLAEVLITLGVIGVVAAMTMSIIHSQIQKFVLKNQFKKVYNTLAQAIQKTYSDLEYQPNCSYYPANSGKKRGECDIFTPQFISNLKVIKTCKGKAKENGCIKDIKSYHPDDDGSAGYTQRYIDNINTTYVLSDGSVIQLYNHVTPIYLVDTNGTKGPNKWGYDLYYFGIYNNKLGCDSDYIDQGGTKCSDMIKNL